MAPGVTTLCADGKPACAQPDRRDAPRTPDSTRGADAKGAGQ